MAGWLGAEGNAGQAVRLIGEAEDLRVSSWRLRGRQPVETSTAGREEGLGRKRCSGSAGNDHGHCLCLCYEVTDRRLRLACQLLPVSPNNTLNKHCFVRILANVFYRGL